MADLSAQDAAIWLETEGALLEGLVSETTAADWQAVINLIRSVGWWYDFAQDGESQRLPREVHEILAIARNHAVVLHVRPVPRVLINFHFFGPETIDFAVEPKELQSQAAVNVLCQVTRRIGRELGKRVALGVEGTLPGQPYAAYDPGTGHIHK